MDIFSGRPNPKWELSPQQRSKFLEHISELNPYEKARHENGLGYRGLIIIDEPNDATKMRRYEVNNGAIQVIESNKLRYVLEDQNYEIEKWLINTAPTSFDQALLATAKNRISSRP
jgi:hypothetical protein